MPSEKKLAGMSDLTPTWSSLMPFMIRVLEDPKASEKAKEPTRAELIRLAALVDKMNAQLQAEAKKE